MEQKKRGRKPLNEGECRSRLVSVLLTDDEFAVVQSTAKSSGLSLSSFARQSMLESSSTRLGGEVPELNGPNPE